MKRFPRRQSANDRELKLIARADQRKADLKHAETGVRDDQKLRARAVIAISRLDKKILPLPASRATLAPSLVSWSPASKRSGDSSHRN
jgi:hypothetical protein